MSLLWIDFLIKFQMSAMGIKFIAHNIHKQSQASTVGSLTNEKLFPIVLLLHQSEQSVLIAQGKELYRSDL